MKAMIAKRKTGTLFVRMNPQAARRQSGGQINKRRMKMKEAKIDVIRLHVSSNRTYGGEGEIKILAEDIKRNGLINPITVKTTMKASGEIYEVIAGRRRMQAVTLLGWKDIPCRILEGYETERADEIAGSENINRLAMHPLDEAIVFHQLLESGRSIEELAKQYDRKKSGSSRILGVTMRRFFSGVYPRARTAAGIAKYRFETSDALARNFNTFLPDNTKKLKIPSCTEHAVSGPPCLRDIPEAGKNNSRYNEPRGEKT
jgi:ParB/RepB/Spo0J family partition protein